MFLSSFFLVETNEEPCAQLQLHEMDQKSDKKKLKQLLLTGNKLKIMWLDHCKKWNLETHMTFVDVDLIEETTEYRFVLLKNYMGWSIWSKHLSAWDEVLLNMEFRSKKCFMFTKNRVKQQKRGGLEGGKGTTFSLLRPLLSLLSNFFHLFPPLWSLDSDY